MAEREDHAELVTAFLNDDPGARDALVAAWAPTVLQWCSRLGGPGVDAEDAAHDVFMVVLTKLASLRDPAVFPAWLFGITRRVLHRHRRKRWLRGMLRPVVPELADAGPDPERLSAASETGRQVQAALARLPEAQREVLILCELEGRTVASVAELVGVSPGTVKSRLRLARARLRRVARQMQIVPTDLAEV